MNRIFAVLSLILIGNLSVYCQIGVDTLYYEQNEIRVYTYLVGKDTLVKAYYDKDARHVFKRVRTNLGRRKEDITLDSIARHIFKYHRFASVSSADFQNEELLEFEKGLTPDFKSTIARDSYLVGAVNYFFKEVERDSTNYLSYYELGKAYNQLHSLRVSSYDKAISYFDTCIQLKPDFEDAYLSKAKVHEKKGIWKGIIRSDPHVNTVDVFEVKRALDCLDRLLNINPDHVEGKRYLIELKDRYGKRYKL